MRPDQQNIPTEVKPPRRRFNLNLYYYEQVGADRYYFRLAPLGWLLIALPIVAILALFLLNRLWAGSNQRENNVNIHIQPTSASPLNVPAIRQAPPPTPPRSIEQPKTGVPAPPSPPILNRNANEQPILRQTPQPRPSKPPT